MNIVMPPSSAARQCDLLVWLRHRARVVPVQFLPVGRVLDQHFEGATLCNNLHHAALQQRNFERQMTANSDVRTKAGRPVVVSIGRTLVQHLVVVHAIWDHPEFHGGVPTDADLPPKDRLVPGG